MWSLLLHRLQQRKWLLRMRQAEAEVKNPKLKPCPFCREQAEIDTTNSVKCFCCPATIVWDDEVSDEDMAATWNRSLADVPRDDEERKPQASAVCKIVSVAETVGVLG